MTKSVSPKKFKQPQLLIVDLRKLTVLCLISAGLYQIYWFYKQWQSLLPPETSGLRLAVYAVFGGISGFGLFKRLRAPYAPTLATAYLILPATFSLLPRPFDLLSYAAVMVPIVLVQQTLNLQHQNITPDGTVRGFEVALVVIGALGLVYQLVTPYR